MLVREVVCETQFLSGIEQVGKTAIVSVGCRSYSVRIMRFRGGGRDALDKVATWWKRRLSWLALTVTVTHP